jgi:hypothetical protein
VKDYIYPIVVFLLVIAFAWFYVRGQDKIASLRTKHNLTSATITNWNHSAKAGIWLDYEFKIDQQTFSGGRKYYELKSDYAKYLVGKQFPIIYSPNEPDNNALLIIPADYDEFGLVRPDSLVKYDYAFK